MVNDVLKIVTFLYFTSDFGRALGLYCQKDRNSSMQPLERLHQDLLCDLEAYKRPVKDPNKITYVSLKFSPAFYEINEESENIRVSGVITMTWMDEYLKWQPSKYGSVNELKVGYYDVWYPKLTSYDTGTSYRFLDAVDRHSFEDAIIKPNGSVSIRSASSLYGPCRFDNSAWPFEEWTCVFTLAKTTDEAGQVVTNKFNANTDIDTTNMEPNNIWKVVSKPPFTLVNPLGSSIEISITVQRHVAHYQGSFIYPGIVLLSLSLISFWLTTKVYCRMMINMFTTLVQMEFLQYLFALLENNGSKGVVLYEFYLDSLFISFTGLLFAVFGAKLSGKTMDPPQSVTEVIGIVAAIPYIGPMFSYLINDDIDSPSAIDDDEVTLVTGTIGKGNKKWRIVTSFLDKFAFVVIVLYLFCFYVLELLA